MNGIVFATGMNTFFGRAAGLVSEVSLKSHLQRAVITIGDYLIILDVFMVALIFIAGLIRNESFFDILGFCTCFDNCIHTCCTAAENYTSTMYWNMDISKKSPQ
jgi:magnesium-transporting ATPase (P-type)